MKVAITESFFAEGGIVAWKRGVDESFEVATKDGTLETKEGPQQYKAGYCILTGPEGEKYSMPRAIFDKIKQDNGDGTATPQKIPKIVKMAEFDGEVMTQWGEPLKFRAQKDYIVRHGKGDYGVVDASIFRKTYESRSDDPPETKSPSGLFKSCAPLKRGGLTSPSSARTGRIKSSSTSVVK